MVKSWRLATILIALVGPSGRGVLVQLGKLEREARRGIHGTDVVSQPAAREH